MTLIDALRQVLANRIGSVQPAQVATVAGALTSNEEGHWPARRLRLSEACKSETNDPGAVKHKLVLKLHDCFPRPSKLMREYR
jgi:hypothetical protein